MQVKFETGSQWTPVCLLPESAEEAEKRSETAKCEEIFVKERSEIFKYINIRYFSLIKVKQNTETVALLNCRMFHKKA